MNTARIRPRSSDCNGRPFPAWTKDRVWRKAAPSQVGTQIDSAKTGAAPSFSTKAHGQRTKCGWVVDHIRPVSRGGTDQLGNLQPLHWRNNRGKGSHWPRWSCTVS